MTRVAQSVRGLLRSLGGAACGLCGARAVVHRRDEVAVRGSFAPLTLHQILVAVAGAKSDSLPNSLCLACTDAAITSYKFLQLCQDYSTTFDLLDNVLQSADNHAVLSKVHEMEAGNLFLVANANEVGVLMNKTEKIGDSKHALNILKLLIKRKKVQAVCDKCGKTFYRKCNIVGHLSKCLNRDLPPKPFGCPFEGCMKTFVHGNGLRLHFSRAHVEKIYPCLVCNKKFGSTLLVTEHSRSMHMLLECRLCKKEFVGYHSLMMHQKDKQTACFKAKLASDLENSNRPASPKTHKCPMCDYTTKKGKLIKPHMDRIHIKVEPRFFCAVCGKGFHKRFELTRHGVTHAAERLEQCKVCGRRFLCKAAFARHTRLHSGEQLYARAHRGARSGAPQRATHVRALRKPHLRQIGKGEIVKR